jgi:fibronectin type 3 domain-containing protein
MAPSPRFFCVLSLVLAAVALSAPQTMHAADLSLASESVAAVEQSGPLSVELAWIPSPSNDVVGYNVYRSTQLKGPFVRINPDLDVYPNYSDYPVQPGTVYYYAVTAVNSDGTESRYSKKLRVPVL